MWGKVCLPESVRCATRGSEAGELGGAWNEGFVAIDSMPMKDTVSQSA